MSRPATPVLGAAFAVALAGMIGTIAPVSGQTQTVETHASEAGCPMGDAAHGGWQAGSAGQLDQRDADAARAHGHRRHDAHRRTGPRHRAARAARRGVSRQGQRSESSRAAKGRRSRQARGARRTILHRKNFRGRRRCGRRLQRLLAGSRTERDPHRRRGAQLDHHRPAERPRAGPHGPWQEAARRDRGALPKVRGVRSPRDAAARRSLPAVVRIERRSADAAELLLQQQLHDRADAR